MVPPDVGVSKNDERFKPELGTADLVDLLVEEAVLVAVPVVEVATIELVDAVLLKSLRVTLEISLVDVFAV